MKKVLLSFLSMSCFAANAQFVIEESDFAVEGDIVIYATDSSFTDLGQLAVTGNGALWDYSMISSIRDDSVLFENPSNFSAGSLFGSSNLTYNQNLFQNFIKINSSGIDLLGYSAGIENFIDTNLLPSGTNIPNDAVFKYDGGGLFYLDLEAELGDLENGSVHGDFTFFFGDSFNVPGTGNAYIDSVRINEDVTFNSEIDGSGTLMLPNGDYYAIRQNVNYVKDYTVEMYLDVTQFIPFPLPPNYMWQTVPGINFSVDETDYRFFGQWQKFPIMEINTEANGAFAISKFQNPPAGSQVGIDKNLNNKFKCFVSNGILNINSNESIDKVEVLDISGRLVEEIYTTDKKMSLDFNHNGIFIVRTFTSDNVYSTKVKN